jgi:hypothetical protein
MSKTTAEAAAVLTESKDAEKRDNAEPDDSFHGRPFW